MPLTGAQIIRLAREIDQQWDIPTLKLFTSDNLGVDLDNIAPDGSLKDRAIKLITILNTNRPPRDGELLEKLKICSNAALRQVAGELLTPHFFAPNDDPHDAIMLGEYAFVDRGELREKLRAFTSPSHYTTRVLVVRGLEPCGKSYSWHFISHLAVTCVGATPHWLRLAGTSYTPQQLIEQIFLLLDLNRAALPAMTDDPQLAHINPLINAFKGQLVSLRRPYWLVIDDINDRSIQQPIRETAFAIARSVEESKPENLWIALLGYNEEITESALRQVAQEDARFPDADLLAEHFAAMSNAGPKPLTYQEARELADLMLSDVPILTKNAMEKLTPRIEKMSRLLRQGERP